MVIRRPIDAIFICTNIDPDQLHGVFVFLGYIVRPFGVLTESSEPSCRRRHTAVIKAITVDDRAVFGQTKDPGFGIAGLGFGGDRPHLNRAKAKRQCPWYGFGILVKPGGKTERVRDVAPDKMAQKPITMQVGRLTGANTKSKGTHRQTVGSLPRKMPRKCRGNRPDHASPRARSPATARPINALVSATP